MPLADFHRSDPFTLGIELELQVVNPPGYDLSQDASTLIADVQHELTVGEAKHDITESMLEIATGVCRDISHAQIQLSAIQQAVQRAALRHHLQICGGGSHPFHAWQRQQISDNPRYVKTVEHFGYLAQQATVFGQHVHVGCQSGDDAIYLLHGLSRFVPHFIALNAASPWFDSTDSRFACSRLNRFSSYPDNGPMPWVADWQGFRRLFRQLSYTSISGFCPAASGIFPKEPSLVKQISKKLFQGGCFFAPKTTGPGYEEERATTYSPNRRLRPPLEDRQQERARCLCALCGGEQYHWDRVWQWRGRWICRLCWARLEKEEEIT